MNLNVIEKVAAEDLRAAMEDAIARTPEQRGAGRDFAGGQTWTGMARTIRGSLVERGAPA